MRSQFRLANATVVLLGGFWGLYWIPLRHLDGLHTGGAWTTAVPLVVACLALAGFAWRGRRRIACADSRQLGSLALGGASLTLYSDSLLYGHVIVVTLMFYLTPVWTTLITRFWFRWSVSAWRYGAIVAGLVGIALVLHEGHGGVPLPRSAGDWLGLASGVCWSVATIGMHAGSPMKPAESNFMFCLGAAVMALILALVLGGELPAFDPDTYLRTVTWTLLIGLLWWAGSLTALMYVITRVDPARVGILLMSEVIVGAISAALLTDEPFGVLTAIGAVLVIAAGVLETMPDRRARRAVTDPLP